MEIAPVDSVIQDHSGIAGCEEHLKSTVQVESTTEVPWDVEKPWGNAIGPWLKKLGCKWCVVQIFVSLEGSNLP